MAPHAPYTVSDATFGRVKELSDQLNVPVHIHLHETEGEVKNSTAGDRSAAGCHISDAKCSPVANLKQLGLLHDKLIAVHMTQMSDEEIAWVGQAGSSVVTCPSSNLKLASGICRVPDLLKAGVNVAIGTDGASSNNTLDMMAEMKLTAIVSKVKASDATVVDALTALRMATLHGARALGLGAVTGSLEVGKQADMIAVDVASGPETWPQPNVSSTSDPVKYSAKKGFDPITHVVYSSTRDQVQDVWVGGQRVLKNRTLTTLDIAQIREKSLKWGKAIAAAMEELKKT